MRDFFLARGLTLTQIACMTPATLRSFGFNVKDREHQIEAELKTTKNKAAIVEINNIGQYTKIRLSIRLNVLG